MKRHIFHTMPSHSFKSVAVLAGLLTTALPSAYAMLPTPLSVVDESDKDVLAPSDKVGADKDNRPSDTADKNQYSGNAEQLLSRWREKAAADNLAQRTTWRRLLYFFDDKKTLFGNNKNQSLVDEPTFFLSQTGRQDSAAELDALLVALADEMRAPTESGESVVCRFPARVHWLSEALNIDLSHLDRACPEFDAWMATLNPDALSIMFAQEYLDNPLSAFAHTLLRIDSPISAANPNQISHAYALNDTVDGDPDDSFVIYALKSISGIYDNIIEIDPYPQKLAKYLQDDERDTWTYRLDLTDDEVRQIMRHVWETKDLGLPYYFTTDNCASEILRLIDVVRPNQQLLSQLPYAVIPSDVIQLLHQEDLLAKSTYTPSDSTRRQAHLNTLNADDAHDAHNLYDNLGYHNAKLAQALPISSMTPDQERLIESNIVPLDNNPLDRHGLQAGSIGIGQRGDDAYVDVGIRAGYHDLLDDPSGFPQFFNLQGLSAKLRFNEDNNGHDSVELQNVTLIKGRSFNPVNSAKKGKSWGTSIEADRVNDGATGRSHLVGSATYESGWSWALGTPRAHSGAMPPQLCYALASGSVQVGRGLYKGYRVGAGMDLGCLYQINNQLRAQAQLALPYWYHGSSADFADGRTACGHYWQPVGSFGLQYDMDNKQAIRVDARYEWLDRVDAQEDIKISYRRYF